MNKNSNWQHKKASEVMTSLFFAAHSHLRWVGVVIDHEEIHNLATDRLIHICHYMPADAIAMIAFQGYDDDQREVWHVPEVRAFVAKALAASPQILLRLELNDRRMMRNCVMDIDERFGTQANAGALATRWSALARAAGLNPWE